MRALRDPLEGRATPARPVHYWSSYTFVILENVAAAFESVVRTCSEKFKTLVLPLRPSGSRPPTTASCEEETW